METPPPGPRSADFVGQVGNLRPIVNRPSGITYKCQHRSRLAALWGSQSWLQPAFSRLLRQRAGTHFVDSHTFPDARIFTRTGKSVDA
jgi:hypothetical protein